MWLARNVLGPAMQQIVFLRVLEMPVSFCAYDYTKHVHWSGMDRWSPLARPLLW